MVYSGTEKITNTKGGENRFARIQPPQGAAGLRLSGKSAAWRAGSVPPPITFHEKTGPAPKQIESPAAA